MPAQEIDGAPDAKARIEQFFKVKPEHLMDYAKFAYFLSNRKLVEEALQKVSSGVWAEYRKTKDTNTATNRFTRAIIRYAANFGFACPENVVFTGPLSDTKFLSFVKDGVLWKDTFAPEHGEFSHTLQWLSGAVAIGWGKKTAELYKNSDTMSELPLTTRVNGSLAQKKVPLWAWLVDCFPSKDQNVNGTDNIFSTGFRVPNHITKLAMEHRPKNSADTNAWFIGLYVNFRQTVTLDEAFKKGSKEEFYESRNGGINKIQAIKSYQTAHYEQLTNGGRKTSWKPDGDTEQVSTQSGAKSVHRVFKREIGQQRKNKQEMVSMTFHNEPGNVPKRIAPSLTK